jgi:hypothetical protein
MQSRVSYRFLTVTVNQATGDRVTVGLLHWDGSSLRFASSARGAPVAIRRDVERTLADLEHRVSKVPDGQLMLGDATVRDVLFVPEGVGSALFWGDLVLGLTMNSDHHFAQLSEAAGFESVRTRRSSGLSELRRLLVTTGQRLVVEYPDLVRLDQQTRGHLPFSSPLTWRNTGWHHSVSLSFAAPSTSVEEQIRSVVGLVRTGLADSESAMIWYVPPRGEDLVRKVESEMQYLKDELPHLRARSLAPPGTEDAAHEIESVVRQDVLHVAAPLMH